MMAPCPDVELRDIQTFLVLAEELHFGKAAARLGVSPSRVSQTIRLLERRIGGPLFHRTSRKVGLTANGEYLLAAVRPPYEQLRQALRSARDAVAGVMGRLRIGMYTESLAGPHMTEIIAVFEARHPGTEAVPVITGLTRNYLDAMRDGDVDLVAARLPISDPDITIGPVLSSEDRVLLVASTDPLARRESVVLDDLATHVISDTRMLPREMVDDLIPPAAPSGHRFRRKENASLEEMLVCIATGKQVHLTTPSFLDYHDHPAIARVPVAGLPPTRTALAWLTARQTPTVRAFAETAAEIVGDSRRR